MTKHMSLCVTFIWISVCVGVLQTENISTELKGFSRFSEDISAITQPLIKRFLPIATQIFSDENISPQCINELLQFAGAINRNEPWAIRIALSSGMLPNNMFEGTLANLGSYEQCLKTKKPNSNIVGKYCTLWLQPPEDVIDEIHEIFNKEGLLMGRRSMKQIERNIQGHHFGFRSGLCSTAGCSEEDLNHVGHLIAGRYGANVSIINCRTKETQYKPLGLFHVCILVFIGLSLAFVVVASIMDLMKKTTKESRSDKNSDIIIKAFSLVQNLPKALSTETPDKDLKFLFGLRTFLALWIVYFHGCVLVQFETFHPGFAVFDLHNTVLFHFGQGTAFLSVSSFFFLSGFMISYTYFTRQPTDSCVVFYFQSVVKRYLRLTWPLVVVILYYMLSEPFVAGPLDGDYFSKELTACYGQWWAILLHINNYIALPDQCYGESWYVSAEMQLYLIALAITLLLPKRPKMAIFVMIFLATCGSIAAYFVTKELELLPSLTYGFSTINKLLNTIKYVYHQIYGHASTYFCGLICGYLTIKYRNIRINKVLQAVLWIVSFSLSLSVMLINMVWNSREDFLPNAWVIHGIYAALHRPLWGLSMMWIVFACATRRGGLLYRFWSWKLFVPLGKLSYLVYLTHYMIYIIRGGLQSTTFQITPFFMIKDCLGVWIMSLALSLYLHVIHEAPINVFEKIIFKKPQILQKEKFEKNEVMSEVKSSNGKQQNQTFAM